MKILQILFAFIGGYFSIIILLGIVYIIVPPVSTLMLARWISSSEVFHENVPLTSINRNLLRAVIIAEDDQFCSHWGVNWNSMAKAIKHTGKRRARGASTISMQVTKNLFLWPGRSYIRKMVELPIAMYIDFIWSKKRIMEVYLSVAEWGDGIFGAEAAAKKYFNKSAGKLTAYEAALMAAALPNPIKRSPKYPSAYMKGYANSIIARRSGADLSCF